MDLYGSDEDDRSSHENGLFGECGKEEQEQIADTQEQTNVEQGTQGRSREMGNFLQRTASSDAQRAWSLYMRQKIDFVSQVDPNWQSRLQTWRKLGERYAATGRKTVKSESRSTD